LSLFQWLVMVSWVARRS